MRNLHDVLGRWPPDVDDWMPEADFVLRWVGILLYLVARVKSLRP